MDVRDFERFMGILESCVGFLIWNQPWFCTLSFFNKTRESWFALTSDSLWMGELWIWKYECNFVWYFSFVRTYLWNSGWKYPGMSPFSCSVNFPSFGTDQLLDDNRVFLFYVIVEYFVFLQFWKESWSCDSSVWTYSSACFILNFWMILILQPSHTGR